MKFKRTYKKECILVFVVALLFCFTLTAAYAPVGELTNDGVLVYQELSNGTNQVHSYLGEHSVIMVPSAYEDKIITEIESDAFANNQKLKEISFTSNIRFVGNHAFYNASNLKGIIVPPREAESFTKKLTTRVFDKKMKDIVMYERNIVDGTIDGKRLSEDILQEGMHSIKKDIGSAVEIELSIQNKPRYSWNGLNWSEVENTQDVSEVHTDEISWYKDNEKVEIGNHLKLDDLNEQSEGLYTAKVKDVVVFQLQLSIDSQNSNNSGIDAGDTNTNQILLFLLGISSLTVYVYSVRKNKIRNSGKRFKGWW